MKKKSQSGNTIAIVLVCLVVISILSLSAIYSISYTTMYRSKKTSLNFTNIILENEGYDFLNQIVETHHQGILAKEEITQIKESFERNTTYHINIVELVENKLTFQLGVQGKKECILVESIFEMNEQNEIINYQITKWGITQWK